MRPLWQGDLYSWQGDPLARRRPCTLHAGRYGLQAGSMLPTGMQSCFKLCILLLMGYALLCVMFAFLLSIF